MKIKSLSTTSFGKFKNKTWTDFSPSINVFYGANEAGKSTVFKMIHKVLFGFKVKNINKNILANQETRQLNVQSQIEIDGKLVFIERSLKDQAQLTIKDGPQYFVYENNPLPYVSHILPTTYEEIYALELTQLNQLNDKTWEDIEDLLMQQISGDAFKSPKQVLSVIEDDIKKIKRQTDRGQSLLKKLEEERREIYKNKKKVQENLEQIDVMNDQLMALNKTIDQIKKNQSMWMMQLEKTEIYLPLTKMLQEKMTLEKSIEAFKNYDDLDEQQYHAKKKNVKALYLKMDDLSSKISKYVNEKRNLLERVSIETIREPELNEVYQQYKSLQLADSNLEQLQKKLQLDEHDFKKEFENTFDEKYDEKHIEEVLNINYLNLKSLIQEIEGINEEIKILKRNKRTGNTSNSAGKIMLFVLMAVISGGVYYLNFNQLSNAISMIMMGIAFISFIQLLIKKRYKSLDENNLYDSRDELRNRLVKELNGIRLSSIVEEFIGHEFLSQILLLKNLGEQVKKDLQTFEGQFEMNKVIHETVYDFLKQNDSSIDVDSKPFELLFDRLDVYKKNIARVELINGQLDVLNESLHDLEVQLNEDEAWLLDADNFLLQYGEGDLEQGIQKLKSKNLWILRKEELEKKIASLSYSEIDLKSFLVVYKEMPDDKMFDKNYLSAEINLSTQYLNDNIIEAAAIKKDIQHLMAQSDLQGVLGKLNDIEAAIENEKIKYDYLLLMQHIIRTSEDVYRNENQPEVFKHAGDYLNVMTDGKYTALEVVETVDSSKSKYEIHVKREEQFIKVDETFSMGTLNQLYLSLRLSLVDHLDEGYSKLPICFDELLVNWDKERLDHTIAIIKKLSSERQVMIFTCHDWFMEALKNIEDVKVFNL